MTVFLSTDFAPFSLPSSHYLYRAHQQYWAHLSQSYFSISSAMKNSGFWKSWCAPISRKLLWSCSRAQTFSTSERFEMTCRALYAPICWICKRARYVGIYDINFFLGGGSGRIIEVYVILGRIRNFKCPNSSCLNFYLKNYDLSKILIYHILMFKMSTCNYHF